MKKLLSIIIMSLSILLLTNCDALTGTEIGRLQIDQPSIDENDLILKQTTLKLAKGDNLAIWSEMDVEYEGDVALRFRMDILKDGAEFGRLEIDPMDKNVTIGEVKTTLMEKTNWSFSGKNAEIKIEEDGIYTYKAILVASENPTLIINKAAMVFKK